MARRGLSTSDCDERRKVKMNKTPIPKAINSLPRTAQIPEITLQYDKWTLRISLYFHKDENQMYYVTFSNVIGFRVLSEQDHLEYWNPETRPKGWPWKIEKYGWFDLEKSRSGFVTGIQPYETLQELKLQHYQTQLVFWRNRIEPVTKAEIQREKSQHFDKLNQVSWSRKNNKISIKNEEAITFWIEKTNEINYKINI